MYSFDINAILNDLMFSHLSKQGKLMSFIKSHLSQLAFLHTKFLQYRKQADFAIHVNGQVCRLRYGLNELFDNALRRIEIEDAPIYSQKYIYPAFSNKPTYLPIFLGSVGYDFVVKVPTSLKVLESDLKAFTNAHKLPTKKYIIIYI